MMEFSDITGISRVTVGTVVMVKAIEGFYDLMVTRAYWDISSGEPVELLKLRGKSGKQFDRVNPCEVAVCLEFFGEKYVPVSFVGDDYVPMPGMFVVVWSDVFKSMLYCEVMARDGDIVRLRYGKALSERKTLDCYIGLADFREATKQL
jgi:hypothetical protein